jgi:hypothetical protein
VATGAKRIEIGRVGDGEAEWDKCARRQAGQALLESNT